MKKKKSQGWFICDTIDTTTHKELWLTFSKRSNFFFRIASLKAQTIEIPIQTCYCPDSTAVSAIPEFGLFFVSFLAHFLIDKFRVLNNLYKWLSNCYL